MKAYRSFNQLAGSFLNVEDISNKVNKIVLYVLGLFYTSVVLNENVFKIFILLMTFQDYFKAWFFKIDK